MNTPSQEQIDRAAELIAKLNNTDPLQVRILATSILAVLMNENYVSFGIAGPEDEQ